MIYVFAGPSISQESIKEILPDATVLPPIRAADILSLLRSDSLPRPSCILILDGYFYSTLSVRHKEIIYAIKQGIPIIGASSMGALRAAELNDYGMIGIGRVYEYYSSNVITSDDEVAILHSQSPPYEPLSTPLINVRLTLDDLVAANELTALDADSILSEISSIHFSDRKAATIDSIKTVKELCPELSSLIIDWKHRDALTALRYLSQLYNKGHSIHSFTLESISLGTHSINYFMDSHPARFVRVGDSGIAYTPLYPTREAKLLDIFKSLNLMSALHLSRILAVNPSDRLRDVCYDIIVSLGPHVDGIPLNDHEETKRLSSCLASLLMIYSTLTNHSAILGNQKALSDNSVFSSIFKEFHNVQEGLLLTLISCLSGGSNSEFADILSKCFESSNEKS